MRIGTIFASGGCRAWKWMAVATALAALGSAQAAAQPTITSITYAGNVVTFNLSEAATFTGTGGSPGTTVFTPSDTSNSQGVIIVENPGVATTALRVKFFNRFTSTVTMSYTASAAWVNSAGQQVATITNMAMTPTPGALVGLASIKVEAADSTGKVGEGVTTMVTFTLDKPLPAGGTALINIALRQDLTSANPLHDTASPTGKAELSDVELVTDSASINHLAAGTLTTADNPANTPVGPSTHLIQIDGPAQSKSLRLTLRRDVDAVDEQFVIRAQPRDRTQDRVNYNFRHATLTVKIDDSEEQNFVYHNGMTGSDSGLNLNRRREGLRLSGVVYPDPLLPANEALSPLVVRFSDNRYKAVGEQGANSNTIWTTGVRLGGPGGGGNTSGSDRAGQRYALNVMPPPNDGNRTDDEIKLEFVYGSVLNPRVVQTRNNCSSLGPNPNDIKWVSSTPMPCVLTIYDLHKLPTVITGVAKDKASGGKKVTAVKEGEKVYVDVSYVNKKGIDVETGDYISDTELFTVTATPADAQSTDVLLTGGTFKKFGPGTGAGQVAAGQFTLEARNDDDIGPEKLTVNLKLEGEAANGPGMEMGTFEIDITDATVKQIAPKAEAAIEAAVNQAMPASFNPGACFNLKGTDLFTLTQGFSATFAATSSSPAVSVETVAGGTIKVCAVSAGMGTVRVVGTAESSSVTSSQTVANTAEVSFDVAVVLGTLTVTVTVAPATMTIMEGGDPATITATANRAVAEDTMIGLTVAGDADAFEAPDAIMIANGMKSGSVELRAREDADTMDETLTVVATGPGISGSQRFAIQVTDNDEAPRTIRAKADAAALIAAAVAKAAGGADWMVGGMAASIDMSTLFEMDAGVRATYSGVSSDNDVVRAVNAGHMLTLTPMAAGAATITVTAADASGGDAATAMAEVMVALPTLAVTVAADAATVMEGASITLTATANRPVTAATDLMLTVTGDMAAVSVPEKLTIAAGAATGTAMLMAVEDDDDAADAMVDVVATGPGIAVPIRISVAVEDNDRTVNARSQAEVDALFVTATAKAGGAGGWQQGDPDAMVDLSALFTTIGSPTLSYTVESSDAAMVAASASGATLTLKAMQEGAATIKVTAADTSGDAADTATVMSQVSVGLLPLEITLMPATAEVTEGGDGVMITATANQTVAANVEVMLMRDAASAAGADDYLLSPSLITIMAGDNSGSLTLTAVDDRAVEGAEMLTLHGRAGDADAGSVAVTIADNDMAVRYELSAAEMNIAEGRSVRLTATACAAESADSCMETAVQMDTEVQIMRDGSSTAGDADYEVAPITIKAGEASGAGLVTAVEDGQPDSGAGSPEMLTLYGMADGQSTNRVSFYLWDAAVPALPLAAQLLLAALLAAGGCRRWRRR